MRGSRVCPFRGPRPPRSQEKEEPSAGLPPQPGGAGQPRRGGGAALRLAGLHVTRPPRPTAQPFPPPSPSRSAGPARHITNPARASQPSSRAHQGPVAGGAAGQRPPPPSETPSRGGAQRLRAGGGAGGRAAV